MSDANADAGVAGAEALLGLAAGAPVRLPRLSALPDPPAERAGPEPPPLALPTTRHLPHHQHHALFPTPPALSLPSHHPASAAQQQQQQQQQQPQEQQPQMPQHSQTHQQYLPSHHLPPPTPQQQQQPHELPHPAAAPYLPPPPPPHPARQDLPSVASLSEWPPPEQAHYRSLSTARPPYDPLHPSPPRLSSLPGSAAVLSQHLHPAPPWDPAHRTAALLSPPQAQHDYPPAPPPHHWPPPPQHAYPYHAPPPGYYYYPGAHATQSLPQPHIPPPSQPAVHLPAYSIPSTLHQQPQVMSPMPPPLALPLPLPRASGAPAHALRSDVSGVHDTHGLRATLPGIDAGKFVLPKDSLLVAAQERAAIGDVAVSKVPDIATAFGPALQANVERRAGRVSTGLGPAQFGEAVKTSEEGAKEAKEEKPRPSRGRGIADLMNPTDTLPGPLEPEPVGMKKLVVGRPKTLEPIATVAEQAVRGLKPIELAKVKEEVKIEAQKRSPPTVPSSEEKKAGQEPEKPIQSMRVANEKHEMPEAPKIEASDELKSEADDRMEESAESEETRCPCGSKENEGVMIACDECNTWQHAKCMGFGKDAEVQGKYFCHICRPEEMRPSCVAYRKYKEKMVMKEKDGKDANREYHPLLASVKPLELRKHFAADLKQKKAGQKLSKNEVFHRYATLLRNQFVKYRQSVIEGIMVVLDMARADVVERLDSTLKRIRAGVGDKTSDDSQHKKRGMEAAQEAVHSDGNGSKASGHVRSHPQKRLRPNSMSVDNADAGHNSRNDASHAGDSMADIDFSSHDPSTSRAMSREERKLQQTMKLFARLEEQEREREKKKPRTGESGGSPKAGHPSRPKTPRPSPQAPAISPKSSGRHPRSESDDRKGSILSNGKTADEKQCEPSSQREKQRKEDIQQKEQQSEKDHQQDQQLQTQSQQQSKTPRKGSGVNGLELEPVSRDQPKREREHKNRDKSDRISLRRKDTGSPDAATAGNGRRRGILERERSQDRKRRRVGTVTRDAERRYASEKEQSRRDSSLDFKLFVPGRSVLGSRLIPKSRLSKLERERLEAEESAEAHTMERSLPNKKHHLRNSLAEKARVKEWEARAPAKRRYRVIEKDVADLHPERKEQAPAEDKTLKETEKKKSELRVSMVLVSERGNLPDKGQMFESSRLVLPDKENVGEASERNKVNGRDACLKKRAKMFANSGKAEQATEAVMTDVANLSPPSPNIKMSSSSAQPRSPSPSSPRLQASPASPRPVRSPMLRSSPAPRVQGLRSVSPTAVGKASHMASPLASPRSGGGSPVLVSSGSPSPDRKAVEGAHDEKEQRTSGTGSPSAPRSKDESKRECDVAEGKALSSGSAKTPVPLSKPKPMPSASEVSNPTNSKTMPTEARKPLPLANGFGLCSLRSVPVSDVLKTVSPKTDGTPRSQKDMPKEPLKTGSPLPSPRRKPLASAGISDIFQQRLQGFLNPTVSSPRESSSGIGLRSGLPPSQSPRTSAGIGRSALNSGPSEPANGVMQDALPSFRSKTLERNSSWRTSFPMNRRAYSSYGSSKGSPGSGSPPAPGGKFSPVGSSDKGRFRSGRADLQGRSEEASRSGPSSQPWNSCPHKNGWAAGSGRPHQSSSDASAKASHRGRH